MNPNLTANKIRDIIIFVSSFIIFSFLSVSQVNAVIYTTEWYTQSQYNSFLSTYPNNSPTPCSDTSGCSNLATCYNSAAVGSTDCPGASACFGGSAWTKFENNGCWQTGVDPYGVPKCKSTFVITGYTYSTADKYVNSNPPVMNAGKCDTNVGGAYKTCCNGTSLVDAQHGNIDILPPDEAWCGGATTVRCGAAGEPACGQAACNTLAPQPAPATCPNGTCGSGETCSNCPQDCGSCPAPPAVTNACDPVGSWCSACDTKTCSDGTICAAGHTYCTYAGTGNYCGACVEEFNNCAAQCASSGGTTVTPTPKYRCNGSSCIRDDTNGTSTASDCGGTCSSGGGSTVGTDYTPPAIHPYAQIRNVTTGGSFPGNVSYHNASYDISNCGTDHNCLLAIESVNQTVNAQPGDTLEVRVMAHSETDPPVNDVAFYLYGDRAVHSNPNGLADDASGNQFCTNTAPDLTSFKSAGITCENKYMVTCDSPDNVNVRFSRGYDLGFKSGDNTGWEYLTFNVSSTAPRGTQAGITAAVHTGGGFYSTNGSWGLNGAIPRYSSSSDSDYNYFRLKSHHPYCPWANDEWYESLPLTVNIPTQKTCTISAPTSVAYPDSPTVSATGNANSLISDKTKIWLERADGQPMGVSVAGRLVSPAVYNGVNYYNLSSCDTATSPCKTSATTFLSPGQYYVHCDLTGNTDGKCSGNPFCNGNEIGGTNCPDQAACSAQDAQLVTVNPKLSGYVKDVDGNPISGVTVNQGAESSPGVSWTPPECLIGTQTTDSAGYFHFDNVPFGKGFCMRPPKAGVPGYTLISGGYECQKAGGFFSPDGCGYTSSANLDLIYDTEYNFTYSPTPISASATCTGSPYGVYIGGDVTWSASASSGGNGTYSYSWTGTDGLSGTNNPLPPKTYSTTGNKYAQVIISSGTSTPLTIDCSPVNVTTDPALVTPWIDTNGDVHSNTSIYAPGGP